MPINNDKMHVYNEALANWESGSLEPFWGEDGFPNLDYKLLLDLLKIPIQRGDATQTGVFANALDLWIARDLEHAGFTTEGVWPRSVEPRAVDPNLSSAIDAIQRVSTRQSNRAVQTGVLSTSALESFKERQALEAYKAGGSQVDANVMGSVYTKQIDVGMSGWLSGPELLISTKTMSGSFGKNIANRFEEAYGDVKNLRERYPLAAHGFFFLAKSSILDEVSAFDKAVHMLRQLSRDGEVYDAVALLLVDWDLGADIREDGWRDFCKVTISERAAEAVPGDLSCENFFMKLIDIVLANSPIDAHGNVRDMRFPAIPS